MRTGRPFRTITSPASTPPLADPCECQSIADGHDDRVDALVAGDLLVESPDRRHLLIVLGGIRDPAAPEGVVDHDQPAGTHDAEAALVVRVVARLVGIDEREVEAGVLE